MISKRSIVDKARKTRGKDDFFDISAIFGRPLALRLIPFVYHTPLSPIHVTLVAFVTGICSAVLIASGSRTDLIAGAIMLQVKNVLDTLDGHLARARNCQSRIGSLLDSNTDFLTNLCVFAAIGYHIGIDQDLSYPTVILVFTAFLSSLLQCSYFVFYLRGYLTVTRSQHNGPGIDHRHPSAYLPIEEALMTVLDKFYKLAYGWQDHLIESIDALSRSDALKRFPKEPEEIAKWRQTWFNNKKHLTLSSILGLGSQLFVISILTALDQLHFYLYIPLFAGNCWFVWLICIRIRHGSTGNDR
jgi:phosphatidylglycerophosphate synthase